MTDPKRPQPVKKSIGADMKRVKLPSGQWALELTGQVFGELTAMARVIRNGRTFWECRCSCDRPDTILIRADALLRGQQSCGCLPDRVVKYPVIDNHKICSKCGKRQPLDCYFREYSGSDAYRSFCKECHNKMGEAWRKANPEKMAASKPKRAKWAHDGNLARNFGLAAEQFEQLKLKAGDLCQICKQPESRKNRRLSLDHDHGTGRLRGFLCAKCNLFLGFVKDDQVLLEMAVAYLRTADLGIVLTRGRSVPRVEVTVADEPLKKKMSYEERRSLTIALRDKLDQQLTPLFDQLIMEADDLRTQAQVDGKNAQDTRRLKQQAGSWLFRAQYLAVPRQKQSPVHKTCPKCHERRRQSPFYRADARGNELLEICRACTTEARQAWEKTNPEKAEVALKQREERNRVRNCFGLTLEQFDQLFAGSDGLCQICKGPERRKRRLSLDHDHTTGRLRGFICFRCNCLLGFVDDDTALLESVLSYLRTADLGMILSTGRSVPLVAKLAKLREGVFNSCTEFTVERHLMEARHVV